eukprot:Gb_05531 [translate_table: standard]
MSNCSKILSRPATSQPIGLYSSVCTVESIKDKAIYLLSSDKKQLIPSATSMPVNIDASTAEPAPVYSDHISHLDASPVDTKANSSSLWRKLLALYHFTHFYTLIGTVVGVTSYSLLAVQSLSDISPVFFIGLLQINKPYHLIASGEFSQSTGVAVALASAFLSLGLGLYSGSQPLNRALYIGLVCGTAYSVELPYFKVEKIPYDWCNQHLVCDSNCHSNCLFLTYADFRFGEAHQNMNLMRPIRPNKFNLVRQVLGHAVLATLLWRRAGSVDIKSKVAFASFYMFVWRLFYAEYLLIPFLR